MDQADIYRTWQSRAAVLAQKSAHGAEKACMLASLLLGFGLDAYVALGCIAQDGCAPTPAAWVVTLDTDQDVTEVAVPDSTLTVRAVARVTSVHWDPETAARLPADGVQHGDRRWLAVGTLFNDSGVWANVQGPFPPADLIWDLRQDAAWHAMPFSGAPRVSGWCESVAVLPATLAPADLELKLEAQLQAGLAELRAQLTGMDTTFDAKMGYVLGPALAAYEQDRLVGMPRGAEDFEAAVKRTVPRGSKFIGWPAMFNHTEPARIIAAMRADPSAAAAIATRSASAVFAVRVHVAVYAADVLAVWVMLAAHHDAQGAGDSARASSTPQRSASGLAMRTPQRRPAAVARPSPGQSRSRRR